MSAYKRGDLVWVKWSTWGRQMVEVLDPPTRRHPTTMRVRKYRAQSRTWTRPIRIKTAEVLGRVSAKIGAELRESLLTPAMLPPAV